MDNDRSLRLGAVNTPCGLWPRLSSSPSFFAAHEVMAAIADPDASSTGGRRKCLRAFRVSARRTSGRIRRRSRESDCVPQRLGYPIRRDDLRRRTAVNRKRHSGSGHWVDLPTPDRASRFAFTDSYLTSGLVLVTPSKDKHPLPRDLGDRRVAVKTGTASDDYVAGLRNRYGQLLIERYMCV